VVIHDFNIVSVVALPEKAETKLVVDANAELAFTVAGESFQVIRRRDAQLIEVTGAIPPCQLPGCHFAQAGWNAAAFACIPEELRVGIPEALENWRPW
jgi:hypothetical protein